MKVRVLSCRELFMCILRSGLCPDLREAGRSCPFLAHTTSLSGKTGVVHLCLGPRISSLAADFPLSVPNCHLQFLRWILVSLECWFRQCL